MKDPVLPLFDDEMNGCGGRAEEVEFLRSAGWPIAAESPADEEKTDGEEIDGCCGERYFKGI